MRAKRPMMVSRVEEDEPGPAGGDSAGPDVLFMVDTRVRLDEVPGYRKRARFKSLSEIGGEGLKRKVPMASREECTNIQ
jgi:hypothetical protein